MVEEVVRRLLSEPWSFVNEAKVRSFVARIGHTEEDLSEWESYMARCGAAAAHAQIQRRKRPQKGGGGGWLSQVGDEW